MNEYFMNFRYMYPSFQPLLSFLSTQQPCTEHGTLVQRFRIDSDSKVIIHLWPRTVSVASNSTVR